jgi:hypothetical protein
LLRTRSRAPQALPEQPPARWSEFTAIRVPHSLHDQLEFRRTLLVILGIYSSPFHLLVRGRVPTSLSPNGRPPSARSGRKIEYERASGGGGMELRRSFRLYHSSNSDR